MQKSHSESYAAAGVDITAGYEAVQRMTKHVQRTITPGVLSGLGGFGGLFAPDFSGMEEPVLISGTDGVGTKLQIAKLLGKHDTIGIDCVAMCVNDIVCAGAKPLFFLDYIACGKNEPSRIEAIVAGISEGCVQAGCALIGGETAEHPGVMHPDEYDLAGFAVGMADKKALISGDAICEGDVILALPSSGVHSNGFSLVRRVFGIDENPDVLHKYEEELGAPLGRVLLTPTTIYVKAVSALLAATRPSGISHITGGGFHENIPRCLPSGLCAKIDKSAVKPPPIFGLIAKLGKIPERDMFNTFNMGVGMCVMLPKSQVDAALSALSAAGCDAYVLGEVVKGEGGVLM